MLVYQRVHYVHALILDNWVWINTYKNTIFRGMNIHFNPAILMWTEGVQGFDTLPYIYIYIWVNYNDLTATSLE